MPLETAGPNAEQIKYWNEVSGPKWVALHEFIDAQIRPLGELAMERARPQAGERVLDVGCGCGATTLALARRVAPGGEITGVDISAPMLGRAVEMAREQGLANVRFENADAQVWRFEQTFDLIFSRFGVMFFTDPVAAFANLGRGLRPNGRLAFVCWQALSENEWMFIPFMAAAQHVPLPAPPAPEAPGPFSFADPERVRRILTSAGYRDVAFDDVHTSLAIGAGYDLDRIVDLLLQIGPTGNAIRDASSDLLPVVKAAVHAALVPYHTPQGLKMAGAAWLVTATAG